MNSNRLHSLPALTGAVALAALCALTLGALALVALNASDWGALRVSDWRAISFTVKQAALSALISVLLAIPLARALARRRFRGRDTLAALLGAPFLLPVIVAILGVIAVWGRSGWLSDGLAAAGLPRLDIYGLPGVLLAHVFFNLPLAARLFLQAYGEIAPERWRVAAQLGVEGWGLFRLLEWPVIRAAAPGAFALIFLLCASSFAVALALGGGPRATTVELAIYEAARYDFDLGRAALLAGAQAALCAAAVLAALCVSAPMAGGSGALATVERWDGRGVGARIFDAAAIGLVCLFLGAPMLAVALRGVAGLPDLGGPVWAASLRSVAVALGAAAFTLALAAPIAALASRLKRGGALMEAAGYLPLAVSPFVIATALLIALLPLADPFAWALPLTAVVNAAMAAPFAIRALTPAFRRAREAQGALADSLGLEGWTRWRALYWPHLRAPLGFAAGLSAALAAGDLGVIALFATPDAPTLPLLMHDLAGSRRIGAAYGAALLLIGLCFALFWGFDRLGRGRR